MGEIKSVKVDNWGVFFLQKLQNFFNKTDYCDLTLQFRDNSQLKVHRLVLSACTDYFNVLEQTCEVIDDALIMPTELQADVVVPIVNFMYTGTLEFELKMYGKLLRTAREMNMTVLLKLLEAHRRTMEGVNRSQRPPSPKTIRRRNVQTVISGAGQQNPTRRILTAANVSPQRRIVQVKPAGAAPNASVTFRQQIGATSLIRTTAAGSYDTQQFKQEPLDNISPTKQLPTSPFEQLRKGYNNNKRPAITSFVSPPVKRPNIEDVKEFTEQQRMRKQIAAEYGDDQEYEGMQDDDIHNYDDDEDAVPALPTIAASTSSRQQQGQQSHQVKKGSATITFKQEQDDKNPTIVVRDTSNSKMNHAKIISEVLRQYPHLVKSNKNIKLKILPNVSGQIMVKKEPDAAATFTESVKQPQMTLLKPQKPIVPLKTIEKPIVTIQKQPPPPAFKLPVQKPAVASSAASTTKVVEPAQKRRIDSKTMHSLIALGAENTTGPWLCLRCGVNGRPISIPSYRSFRRHLINTHKENIDEALCEHCGWRSSNNRELHFHMLKEHNVKTTLHSFPECSECGEINVDLDALEQHRIQMHNYNKNNQQCIYCNKIFAQELQLYTHMKTYHKKQALDDGIIDESDGEEFIQPDLQVKKETKIKILSDISLPIASSLIKLDSAGEISLSRNKQTLKTSNQQTKFVNADGNEMVLTDEQRKQIIAQLNQEHHSGNVVMMLGEAHSDMNVLSHTETEDLKVEANDSEENVEEPHEMDDEKEKDESDKSSNGDDFDDSEIYRDFNASKIPSTAAFDKKVSKSTASNIDESKESADNLEWAENLISEHELADDLNIESEQKTKKNEDISKKLQELTGDWTDDENDSEEEAQKTKPESEQEEEETTEVGEKHDEDEDEDNDDDDDEEEIQHTEQSAENVIEPSKEVVEKRAVRTTEVNKNSTTDVSTTSEVKQIESNNGGGDDNIGCATDSLSKNKEVKASKVEESCKTEDEDVKKSEIKKEVSSEKLNEADENMEVDHDEEEFVKLQKSAEKKRSSIEKLIPEEGAGSVSKTHKTLIDEFIAEVDKSVRNVIETSENLVKSMPDAQEKTTTTLQTSKTDATEQLTEEAQVHKKLEESVHDTPSIASVQSDDGDVKAGISDTTCSTVGSTADKVKSLIKEWIDEEAEDDGGEEDL